MSNDGNGQVSVEDSPPVTHAQMAEILLIQNKIFAQTTWLCRIVEAMIQTMPPQMRPVLKDE